MVIDKSVIDGISVLSAMGSCASALIAFIQLPRVLKAVKLRSEKLYGTEAEERYAFLSKTLSENDPRAFGPEIYKGGNN